MNEAGPKYRRSIATTVRSWVVVETMFEVRRTGTLRIDCQPFGPPWIVHVLIHGLPAVAIECRRFAPEAVPLVLV